MPVAELALAIAACVTGKVEVEESVRSAGRSTLSETQDKDQFMIEDPMRHVDGTEAIEALARKAKEAGVVAA